MLFWSCALNEWKPDLLFPRSHYLWECYKIARKLVKVWMQWVMLWFELEVLQPKDSSVKGFLSASDTIKVQLDHEGINFICKWILWLVHTNWRIRKQSLSRVSRLMYKVPLTVMSYFQFLIPFSDSWLLCCKPRFLAILFCYGMSYLPHF